MTQKDKDSMVDSIRRADGQQDFDDGMLARLAREATEREERDAMIGVIVLMVHVLVVIIALAFIFARIATWLGWW